MEKFNITGIDIATLGKQPKILIDDQEVHASAFMVSYSVGSLPTLVLEMPITCNGSVEGKGFIEWKFDLPPRLDAKEALLLAVQRAIEEQKQEGEQKSLGEPTNGKV